MNINKYDIGGEIISILTKGMYSDPKDALREYIQNGVDAAAKNINIKIRQKSIIIEDDGYGMNNDVLRKAIRVGISEKNPSKNVGFMGIGIYSAFHLCDKLTIYSRGTDDIPNRLELDFGTMKAVLEQQKEKRLKGKVKPDELIDLQTLLESYITITDDNLLGENDFPNKGTRVELTGLETEFYSGLSDFDEVAEYLRNVIPLHFDQEYFTYANLIEKKIASICESHNQKFEIINLVLQINAKSETLYRPYADSYFYSKEIIPPLKPIFYSIKNKEFFGVAWGCLNSVRKKVENKSLRGFILKKQGFSIGRRDSMVKFFPRGNTFFDRYSGEIIIVNPKLMPNAARTEIEYSPLRNVFYEELVSMGEKYDQQGNEYQEYSKGDDELSLIKENIKNEVASYNNNEGDPQTIVDKIVFIKDVINNLQGRIDRKGFREESNEKAKTLLKQAKDLLDIFQTRLNNLTKNKKSNAEEKKKTTLQIAKKLSQIKIDQIAERLNYDSLYELLIDLEFNVDDDLKEVIFLIDENFIQKDAKTREAYFALLNDLKNDILNL
jgi:hypothetical protein